MMDDAVTQAVFQALPPEFFAAVVHSFAEMTIDFVRRHAKEAEKYRELGFKLTVSAASASSWSIRAAAPELGARPCASAQNPKSS